MMKQMAEENPMHEMFIKMFGKQLIAEAEMVAKKIIAQRASELISNADIAYKIAQATLKLIPMDQLEGPQGKVGKMGGKGDTGKEGKQGKQGPPGPKGEDAEIPVEMMEGIKAEIMEKLTMPDMPDIPDLTAELIVEKINSGEVKIDWSKIKNAPDLKRAGTKMGSIHRGGLKIIWDTQLEGAVNGVNKVFTLPASLPDPKDNRYIVSARGVLKTVDGGDFTVSNKNRTITFTAAPPNGSDAPRIVLYHGK